MSNSPWYRWPIGAFKSLAAGVGWEMFCWATGYKGFVCDHARDEQLPCDKWFLREGGEGTFTFIDGEGDPVELPQGADHA